MKLKKTLIEKYNAKLKERKKDKEGDDVMEDPEDNEEIEIPDDYKEISKKDLNKCLKYIKKEKLIEYQKLYGTINGNVKLKKLITSDARCILFAPSKVKDAIRDNENMEIREPVNQPEQQQQELVPEYLQEYKVPDNYKSLSEDENKSSWWIQKYLNDFITAYCSGKENIKFDGKTITETIEG